jgi:hypothetical protein
VTRVVGVFVRFAFFGCAASLGMETIGKRETQLVVYPDEYHGKRPSFLKDRMERYLDWLKNM